MLEDVQKFYSINNAQAGLLQTSFIISYMLLSPIFGYLGDRYNRIYIMAAGVLFWSLVTMAGSFIPREVKKNPIYLVSCTVVCSEYYVSVYFIVYRLYHHHHHIRLLEIDIRNQKGNMFEGKRDKCENITI